MTGTVAPRLDPLATLLDQRFRKPLMSYFLRRVGSRAEAEDLTQDVFVRLLDASERRPIEDVEALVFVTAANLLKDRARRSQRRSQHGAAPTDAADVSAVTHEFVEDRDPERVLLGRESISAMLAALDELGERTRDIYILFRLENMKQAEIAALFNVSRSTVEKEVVKATLHLALRRGREGA
ncbi:MULTISPECIES: RNA polymerase sigma factor [Brevundimonas]|uniref:Sigma factor, ECF subfamily n=1 Tax=Brevundimonas abyssalis TAR-001 TaxID=1391729 RepID=A0A8E0KJA2_9CAUL|nr:MULTISPECIES: sigma-70 family RNA polymerase sigma factor [Brevundimonas]GAD58265.1 sigma factor, ECF subfamily [Brevundimonas abyssalis TAR-001]